MIYEPQIHSRKPYGASIWYCNGYHEHCHSQTEVYICLCGQLTIRVEGIDYPMEKDDTLFVASNESHRIFCDHPDTQVIIFNFGNRLLGSAYSVLHDASFEQPFFNLQDPSVSEKILHPLFQIKNIMLNFNKNDIAQDWELRGCLHLIAAYLATHKRAIEASRERKARVAQLANMNGVLDYIAEHFQEPITVDTAASIARYDKSYFCKQFRKATGMTFHRYLNYCRISVACQHLVESNMSISVIAEESGFASAKMMNRLFRDILGVTPTEYRNHPSKRTYGIH